MGVQCESESEAYAVVLAHALADVANELRSIDLVDLVGFIRFGNFAAIEDLVQSSTELFFREGTVTFGWTATVDLEWGELPVVVLGMEFRHGPVSVFFDLLIEAASESIDVAWVLFDPAVPDPEQRLRFLIEALAEAPRGLGRAAPRLALRRQSLDPGGGPRLRSRHSVA